MRRMVEAPGRRRVLRGALAGGLAVAAVAVGTGTSRAALPAAPVPTVLVGDAAIVEGNAGVRVVKVPVTLSAPLDATEEFRLDTIDDGKGGATPGVDYKPVVKKTKKLRAGKTAMVVSVPIYGDTSPEAAEQVLVRVTPVSGPPVAMAKSTGSILLTDDDSTATGPVVSVSGSRVFEGDAGHRPVPLALTLSDVQSTDVYVTWETQPDTAVPGIDYKPAARTTVIKAGRRQAFANVGVYGDTTVEPEGRLHVVIDGVSGGSGITVDPSAGSGLIVISDDDDDADADGLVNAAETALKTDPLQADSDGDGLLDGFEVRVSFTNPNQSDTDGDGVSDLMELKAGTNPLDPNDHP